MKKILIVGFSLSQSIIITFLAYEYMELDITSVVDIVTTILVDFGMVVGICSMLVVTYNSILTKPRSMHHGVDIKLLPWTTLQSICSFLLPKKSYELKIDPMFADWCHEYLEALSKKQKYKCYWLNILYAYKIISSTGLLIFIINIAKHFTSK